MNSTADDLLRNAITAYIEERRYKVAGALCYALAEAVEGQDASHTQKATVTSSPVNTLQLPTRPSPVNSIRSVEDEDVERSAEAWEEVICSDYIPSLMQGVCLNRYSISFTSPQLLAWVDENVELNDADRKEDNSKRMRYRRLVGRALDSLREKGILVNDIPNGKTWRINPDAYELLEIMDGIAA